MRNYSDNTFLAATLFIASTFSWSAWAAPRSFPITCRGGAGTLRLTTMTNNAVFNFIKSSGPASAGLQPGECAWLDRAVGAGEPSCIQQYSTNATAWIFPDRQQDSYFSSDTGNHWLRDLLSDSKYVTFQAYNPHSGACMVITRVGE
jgi:hypothetical protein